MHDIPQRLAGTLLEIEALLRRSGKWESVPPPAAALSSPQPFCIDTLSLEQWLQWIMLPRMKDILEQQQPLPLNSAIAAYAEECLHAGDPQVLELIALIRRFDELIAIQARAKTH